MSRIKKVLTLFLITSLVFFNSSPVKAVFTKLETNPVLNVGGSGQWDSSQVNGSSVLLDGENFRLWFDGNDSNKRQIGYAESPVNPLGFVKHIDNPILPWNIINGSDVGVEHPSILKLATDSSTIHKMWFNNVYSSFTNFKLFYSSSTDGISWNTPNELIFDLSNTFWDSQGMGAPAVLYNTGSNDYHLWYVAKGAYNSITRWRIGHAISNDGINWNKHPTPVLEASVPWEGNDTGNPTVLLESGVYHMWYHGDFGIGHATSTDGINWVKDPANPVLVLSPNTFDSTRVFNPYVLKKDNQYWMYYTGIGSDGKYRIGLAIEDIAPTPTPTPSPTFTLTPTSTPTLTPTPTPPKVTKVFVIPGLGASWNADAILNCKSSGYDGSWVIAPYFEDIYNPILDTLSSAGYTAYSFPYDWRKDVRSSGDDFKNEVDTKVLDSEKVHAVGHSLGGLVGRAYIEQEQNNNKLHKFMTVGSPHQGTPLSYPAWSGGDIWNDNLFIKIAATILLKRCSGLYGNDRQTIQNQIPSIRNLLPTFDYLREKKTGLLKPESGMTAQNNWLPNGNFSHPFFGTTVGALSGTGFNTLQYIPVNDPNNHDQMLGNFLDGRPAGKEHSKEGDGTILSSSSMIPDADNRLISENHTGLIANEAGINEILDFLDTTVEALSIAPTSEPTSALLIIGYPSSFWITDPSGKIVKDKENMVSILNPKAGNHRLLLLPHTSNTLLIVGQFLDDGTVLWDEESLKNKFPKLKTIKFNP